MAAKRRVFVSAGIVAAWVGSLTFVTPPTAPKATSAISAGSAISVIGLGSSAVHADQIGDAAKKLAQASYPFAKEVDWNSPIYLQAPGKFQPLEALKAIDKMILMGARADAKALRAAAEAHHKAIGSISRKDGVTSQADWEAVNAAIGKVIASVPESTVMDVYNAVTSITSPAVPAYLKSQVNSADAEKAYAAFLEFKDAVKANQVISLAPATPSASGDKIGLAAAKLSAESYPFLKGINWLSDLYLKPLPGVSAKEALQALDKAIVLGVAVDTEKLKAAAEAHHKAIQSIDAKGVTSQADYAEINAALGRVVASAPTSKVMDVYNAFAKIVSPQIPNNLFSMQDPLDALAAYKAFLQFKDVVNGAK